MNHQTTRPHTATEFLDTAASTLGERGKQYDPAGKQERSMTAIVAAFNAIFPAKPITVHQGWQFMCLVKMVRGATKPHIDSALDQVAYASLAAEEVANQFVQPATTAQTTEHYVVLGDLALLEAQSNYIMNRVREGATVKIMSDATARRLRLEEELEEEPMPTAVKRVEQLLDIETINDLRAELAMRNDAVRGLCELQNKRNAELCAELSRAQDEIQSLLAEKRNLTARNKELEDKVQSLNNEVEAKVRELMSNLRHEAPCAHNTDEPKAAPRPEYVDPFDQYGDMRSPMHRLVGDRDPARGGLAYPAGKDAPTPQ